MANVQKPKVVRYGGWTSTSMEAYPEDAQQDYQADALVFIHTTGKIQECDGANSANIVTNGVLGFDTLAASGTEDTERRLEPLTSHHELKMSVYHSTPASAITAQTMVGQSYPVTLVTIGGVEYWVVDIETAPLNTNAVVFVTKIAPEFPEGELYGTVYCKVNQQLLQYENGTQPKVL